jgi:hypothetical protein
MPHCNKRESCELCVDLKIIACETTCPLQRAIFSFLKPVATLRRWPRRRAGAPSWRLAPGRRRRPLAPADAQEQPGFLNIVTVLA